MSEFPDHDIYVDESAWLYMAGAHACNELVDDITNLCHAAGWSVYRPEGRAGAPRQRLEALRHADGVIADLSSADAETLSDLEAARNTGRPILALEYAERSLSMQVKAVLDDYDRVVVLSCTERRECLQRTGELLAAEPWRALVRRAMAGPNE